MSTSKNQVATPIGTALTIYSEWYATTGVILKSHTRELLISKVADALRQRDEHHAEAMQEAQDRTHETPHNRYTTLMDAARAVCRMCARKTHLIRTPMRGYVHAPNPRSRFACPAAAIHELIAEEARRGE